MKKQKRHQKQQCFQQQDFQQLQNKYLQTPIHYQLVINVHKQLPANQIRNILRPQSLVSRTLISNKCMSLLPFYLNESCIQSHGKTRSGISRIKIPNKQRLSLQQYFSKKQYKEIYNRFSNFQTDKKSFTGKILSIDSVTDYNSKLFRQLEYEANLLTPPNQDTIDADFQSGNLCKVFVPNTEQNQYFLMIQNDINTYGYNIWFFFRFRNIKKGTRRFHLMNMVKKTANYKKGMQISVFSTKKHLKCNTMWQKTCDSINFSQTNFTRMLHLTEKYYSLSFQYDFQQQNDQVYFAMNQPYTYTRMTNHIKSIESRLQKSQIKFQIKKIGHTLADNIIPALKFWKQSSQNKQTILIMARQHPCETVSSFVCEGMINHLINRNIQTNMLLQKYQIIFIPMINPDGVIHGSSRCNLAGFDLNRQWNQFLIKQFTPETHKIRKFILQTHKQNPIKYFFDLHGHGKKLNSFFFSCKKSDNPSSRLIQLAMNKIEPCFNILDCTYGIDRDKQSTIRSQLYHLGVQNCYTLQNSLMGYINGQGQIQQYTEKDLFHIGQSVWKGIFALDNCSEITRQVLGFSKQELLQSSQNIIAKICQKQKDQKRAVSDDNASDSDPEGDILDINQRLQNCCKNNINLKKKITQHIKKEKIKKKKNFSKSLKKDQKKNSSNSQHDSLQILTNSNKTQNQQKKMIPQKQLSLSQQKKNMNKLSLTNKRTTIYSKKMKEKKQNFKQTKVLVSQNQIMNKSDYKKSFRQTSNATQIKFLNQRLKSELKNDQKTRKASCSMIYEYPNQGMLATRRKMSYKMKTEGNISGGLQKQIPGVYYYNQQGKSQVKYSQLREQSLKSLLIDTFSVLKIKPKLSIKRYVKVNPHQKQKRQIPSIITNNEKMKPLTMDRRFHKSEKKVKSLNKYGSSGNSSFSQRMVLPENDNQFTRTQYEGSQFKRSFGEFKYKRFQSFLHNSKEVQKQENHNNSVFYYFPVL